MKMNVATKTTLLGLLVSALTTVEAANFNEPHPHVGKVPPFSPGNPNITLDNSAESILAKDKPYQTQIQTGTSGRGLVVQDVRAPPEIVWSKILDYDRYAEMVPRTLKSSNYLVKNTGKNGEQTIHTRMTVGFSLVKLEFFVKHLYYPAQNSLTWTLDYDKHSDFDDSVGFWYIIPHPNKPNFTRVYYSVDVSMFDWVPGFVMDIMSSKALTDATGWVKKFSEMEAEKQGIQFDVVSGEQISPSITNEKKKKKHNNIFSVFNFKKRKEEKRLKEQQAEEAKRKAAAEEEAAARAAEEQSKRTNISVRDFAVGFIVANLVLSLMVRWAANVTV